MAKTYVFKNENSTLIMGDKTLKSGDEITLKKEDEIAIADKCVYLEEKKDGKSTDA